MKRRLKKYRYWLAAGGVGLGVATGFGIRRARRNQDITGQTVLITGGSRGLGLAMAREFARHNCRIAICARDEAELEKARLLLDEEGVDVFTIACDVSDRGQADEMVRRVREHYGQIDILVNNAGEILVAPIENVTHEDFGRAMAVMFWGVLHPTLAVLPEMRARRSGRIAAITSIGGKVSVPHLLPYSCAKFAAVAFCEGLRTEMASHGVKITTIAPGLMRTGSYVNARFKGQAEQEAAWFSAAATLPLISMSAERAARQAVSAIRRGRAERILSTQANLLARAQGVFPGLIPNILSMVNRVLPGPTPDAITEKTGAEVQSGRGLFRAITLFGRRAGARLNQAQA
jgi:NAD(P)-dependent dehydrogenase (short-subunit alcohol dehydrogenase family)